MAALTDAQMAKIRRFLENKLREASISLDYEKQHVNTAINTINTLFDDVKSSWSSSVNTATEALSPPYTFTNAQKKPIFAYWLVQRFFQEDE